MLEHDGDEGSDRIRNGLIGKCIRSSVGEGRGYDRHRVKMGIKHFLHLESDVTSPRIEY